MLRSELRAYLIAAAGRIKAPKVHLRPYASIAGHRVVLESGLLPTEAVLNRARVPESMEYQTIHYNTIQVDLQSCGIVWLLVNAAADLVAGHVDDDAGRVNCDRLECEQGICDILLCSRPRATLIVKHVTDWLAFCVAAYTACQLPACLDREIAMQVREAQAADMDMYGPYTGMVFNKYEDGSKVLMTALLDAVVHDSGERNEAERPGEPLHPEYSLAAARAFKAEHEMRKWDLDFDMTPEVGGLSDVFGPKPERAVHPIAFKNLVEEITQDYTTDIEWDERALALLQDATEAFVAKHINLEAVEEACKVHGGSCACRAPKHTTANKRANKRANRIGY